MVSATALAVASKAAVCPFSAAFGVGFQRRRLQVGVIDVAIRRLRAKIDEEYEPRLIHTLRGMGYMLDTPDET